MVTGLLNPAIDIQRHALGNPGLLGPQRPRPLSSHTQNTIAPLRPRENPFPPSTGFSEKSEKLTPNLDGAGAGGGGGGAQNLKL